MQGALEPAGNQEGLADGLQRWFALEEFLRMDLPVRIVMKPPDVAVPRAMPVFGTIASRFNDDGVTSLSSEGRSLTSGGTSVAAPFVTGTLALLWSVFPAATAMELKLAVTRTLVQRRTSVAPPLLDAWAAYQTLAQTHA